VELVLFAIWCFLVAVAGGLVGLVLGNLRLPATIIVAPSAAAAAGANLAISAIAAATAAAVHIRAGRINWRLFAWMAPPSILGAVAGGLIGGTLPDAPLLIFIALVLFYSAWELWKWTPPTRTPQPTPEAGARAVPDEDLDIRAAVISGAAVGLLGGIVGLILGSLRMPALLRWVGETPHRAVGTNVAVGLLVGVAGALAHIPSAPPDLDLILVGGAASVPGALIGSRLTGRLSEAQLVHAIAVVLLLTGTGCLGQAVT
jgi:uncharacterized membrane protein YfcA